MKAKFLLLCAITCIPISLFAQTVAIYKPKPVPFTYKAANNEILVVDYDFSGKSGIKCNAERHQFKIEFLYKGRKKSAALPVTLVNHVPDKKGQELMDMTGQFKILAANEIKNASAQTISCIYLEK